MNPDSRSTLVNVFKKSTDPLNIKEIRRDFHSTLALIFPGLLTRIPYIAHIQHWAETLWHALPMCFP